MYRCSYCIISTACMNKIRKRTKGNIVVVPGPRTRKEKSTLHGLDWVCGRVVLGGLDWIGSVD